jgi:2'-5' RNA ligase
MDQIRTFIAFDIPPDVLDHIRGIQAAIAAGGLAMRRTPPENIHLTLQFLGNIRRKDVESIAMVMAKAARGAVPIRLRAKGLGVFPGLRRPRVLWIGLKGDTAGLMSLHHHLTAGLADLGFEKATRPFKAHLTIARARGPVNPKALLSLMERSGTDASPPFSADKMILYQSELFPAGPVYTALKTAVLKGRPMQGDGCRQPEK